MNQTEINKTLSEKLLEFRKLKGLTQEDVGKAIGTSTQQYQKYEGGQNRINAARLFVVAEFMGVSVAEFFPSATTKPQDDKEIQELISKFKLVQSSVLQQMIKNVVASCVKA